MEINYYKAHSTTRPEELDTTSSASGVYLRKNIQEVQRETQEGTQTEYEYDEAYLTNAEYAEFSNVDSLKMTALDFIKVLKALGITSQEIHDYLDAHEDLKDELTFCQNVYCGVVKQLCPLSVGNITITTAMVEQAFKTKNGVI